MKDSRFERERELIKKYDEVNGKIIEGKIIKCKGILEQQKSQYFNSEMRWVMLILVVCGLGIAFIYLF